MVPKCARDTSQAREVESRVHEQNFILIQMRSDNAAVQKLVGECREKTRAMSILFLRFLLLRSRAFAQGAQQFWRRHVVARKIQVITARIMIILARRRVSFEKTGILHAPVRCATKILNAVPVLRYPSSSSHDQPPLCTKRAET
jgi:hypothetical protein